MNARRFGIAIGLTLTVALGLVMRWSFAAWLEPPLPMARLRHAHAHLGYYGLMVPLAWRRWWRGGLSLPRWMLALYAACTAVSIAGFLRGGYTREAIAGSIGVGAVWLFSAWRARPHMRTLHEPLGAVPIGLVLALAAVPPVARFTRTAPTLAATWIATFLSALLLLVVLPSALSALRARLPWPALLAAGVLGSLHLGVWPSVPGALGLATYGALCVGATARARPGLPVVVAWALAALGMAGLATGVLPHVRPVIIGALHFLVLSLALPPLLFAEEQNDTLWLAYHVAVGLLTGPLVLQAFAAGPWTWDLSALGGTGVTVLLLTLGVRRARARRGSPG